MVSSVKLFIVRDSLSLNLKHFWSLFFFYISNYLNCRDDDLPKYGEDNRQGQSGNFPEDTECDSDDDYDPFSEDDLSIPGHLYSTNNESWLSSESCDDADRQMESSSGDELSITSRYPVRYESALLFISAALALLVVEKDISIVAFESLISVLRVSFTVHVLSYLTFPFFVLENCSY